MTNNKLTDVLKLTLRSGLFWGLVLGLVANIPIIAQDNSEELEELEEFIVTGSRIKRIDIEGPSPVYVLSREDISISGATDLQQLLRDLPQNQLGLNDEAIFGFTPGASGVNLRGAGLAYTLTLINGRRAAQYGKGTGAFGTTGFVNTSAIPLSALERIEVLPDSASAIYGADAVAGVINYILRKDYEGLNISTNHYNTFDTDTSVSNISLTGGASSAKSSALVSVDYTTKNALFRRDRPWSATADQSWRGGFDWPTIGLGFPPYAAPAIIRDSGGNYYVTSPDAYTTQELLNNRSIDGMSFSEMVSTYGSDVITEPNTDASLSPESSILSLLGNYNYSIADNMVFYLETSFSKSEVFNSVHPVAMDTETEGLTLPATNPFNPLGANRTDGGVPEEVVAYHRNRDIGQRTDDITTETIRVVAGIKGTITDKWEWLVETQFMTDGGVNAQGGGTLRSATQDSFNATDPLEIWNIFGAFSGGPMGGTDNNDEVIPGLRAIAFNEFESKTYLYNASITGPIFEIPAGSMQMSFGGEFRSEEFYDRSDAASQNGDLVGQGGGNPSVGNRDVVSTYIEFSIPVVEQFEAQIAARYEKFSGEIGDNLSPKVGLSYRPLKELMFRASYSQGFRAPSLPELFEGEKVAFADAGIDPFRGNEAVKSVRVRSGGNPFLSPETSDSIYVGFVYEPGGKLDGFKMSIDWTSIDIENIIEEESFEEIIELNDFRVIRGQTTPADAANGWLGKIIEIQNFFRNKAIQKVRALDYTLEYTLNTENYGSFRAKSRGSWAYSRQTMLDIDSEVVENRGTYSQPEHRINNSLTWSNKDYKVFTSLDWISGYDQWYGQESWAPAFGLNQLDVESFLTWGMGFEVTSFYDTRISINLINILDQEPPLADRYPEGYDALVHNPFGRRYGISLSKDF